ncbi:putative tricarboxylic transport membrane protein [Paraburkholderia sp. JPY465]|uniref:tripartite tricarboxylate transporter permease n=1 Tax=Paraburkholderia sp. JPY465 TaxID=3042285 RepID=UPI003D1C219D
MLTALHDLTYGFGVAFQQNNLLWSFLGVLIGNVIGVLPGMGALTTISILMPLTYAMQPVPAILMMAGIFYGSQYGGAIGAILLNLPSHPPHAVTCLDGYPMARSGRAGTALGLTMFSSFFSASAGILIMVFASHWLVRIALDFGAAEIFSIMFLGLVAGSTLSPSSPLKGVAMTLFGLLCGTVGTDVNSGVLRFNLGFAELSDGLELVAIAMGLFGVADFLLHSGRGRDQSLPSPRISVRDMLPGKAILKRAVAPMLRGTGVGILFGAMPGTGSTITTFFAYAIERRISRTPEKFGTGMIEGVAAPEAAAHSKTQVDFIPTMSLGIPGDAVMALLLGALTIQGIQPGPQLIVNHPDIFWGLVASFWVGNVILMLFNIPLIGVWVRLLRVPYRYLLPSAMFFIVVGVYSTQNDLFQVWEVLAFGLIGAVLLYLEFPMAPILLGFVLGPLVEENFRRSLLISHGSFWVFFEHPISCVFMVAALLLLLVRVVAALRGARGIRLASTPA